MAGSAVKVADALTGITRLFLDTAPIIYLVERNPQYFDVVFAIFDSIDNGQIAGITSPVTLAETLVIPHRLQSHALRQEYIDQVVHGPNTTFVTVDDHTADQAADFRARYSLGLADAFQVAVAVGAGCEALLTNDAAFRRVMELRVLLVNDLEL